MYYHKEHTIVLTRERVNKGTKRMNSLPVYLLSSLSLRDYGKTYRCLQILRKTVALKLVPRPFLAQRTFFFDLYINLTREAALCQNILNGLRIFA